VAIAAVLVGLSPAPALAQVWDFLKWLNDMSGQQMVGVAFDLPVRCTYNDGKTVESFFDCVNFVGDKNLPEARRSLTFGIRAGLLYNKKDFSTEDNLEIISQVLVGPSVTWTPRGAPVLDLTAALQFGPFIGDGIDHNWSTVLDFGPVIKPFAAVKGSRGIDRFGRSLRVGLRYAQFLNSFEGADFNAPGAFVADTEGVWTITFGFDLAAK
jgi:hypothetical protein